MENETMEKENELEQEGSPPKKEKERRKRHWRLSGKAVLLLAATVLLGSAGMTGYCIGQFQDKRPKAEDQIPKNQDGQIEKKETNQSKRWDPTFRGKRSGTGKIAEPDSASEKKKPSETDKQDISENTARSIKKPDLGMASEIGRKKEEKQPESRSGTEKLDGEERKETFISENHSRDQKEKATLQKKTAEEPSEETTQRSTRQSSESSEAKEEKKQSAHKHQWRQKSRTVHHEAVIQKIQVVDQESYTEPVFEERTVYRQIPVCICDVCGASFSSPEEHFYVHIDWETTENPFHYHIQWMQGEAIGTEQVQTGTITHPQVVHEEIKVLQEAYDEEIPDGMICEECGSRR